MDARTNAEWRTLIEAKIAEVEIVDCDIAPGLERPSNIARLIDHTALKPESTEEHIDRLCGEARKYDFKSCCVNGAWVHRAVHKLEGSNSVVACVVGFPLGATDTMAKVAESSAAIAKGARELDMVIHIGALKSGNYAEVYEDVLSVSRVCSTPSPRIILKAIVETALLTSSEIVAACYIAAEAGVNFVKTCTGFNKGKATVDHVRLMYKTVKYKGGKVQVKASGGVRDLENAVALCKAGASRIGTSAGVEILLEAQPHSPLRDG
ncbi:MAG: hypothetical protein M1840_004181 [Geoglossum simile]|nr:MAG: hypothetical protein M1840_004181 [Geoglossum simile]